MSYLRQNVRSVYETCLDSRFVLSNGKHDKGGTLVNVQRICLHRGSYMSAHVLLNLLNELGKRDKIRGLPSILSLFRNEFKFNYTRARTLDSIYHMTNTLKSHFSRKKRYNFVIVYATLFLTSYRVPKIDKPLVVYRFYCMALFHSQTRRHMINKITPFQMSRHCLNGQLLVYVNNGRLDHVSDCISSRIVTG